MPAHEIPLALVASASGDVLVEYEANSGNAGEIARSILRKLPHRDGAAGRRSFSYGRDGYTFHFAWAQGGLTFACLERGMADAAVWQLLGRVRSRWEMRFGSTAGAVSAGAAAPFEPMLSELLGAAAAAAPSAEEELEGVHERLNAVRTVMADSIEKVLERGERIDLLVDRTDALEANAKTFAKSSTSLKRSLRWRSVQCYLAAAAAGCGALLLLLAFSCGGLTLPACRAGGADGYTRVT